MFNVIKLIIYTQEYRNLSKRERAHNEGRTKKNNKDDNVRMSNKRTHSKILARKKKNRVFFSANEQPSRDIIKWKQVKEEEEKKDIKLHRR